MHPRPRTSRRAGALGTAVLAALSMSVLPTTAAVARPPAPTTAVVTPETLAVSAADDLVAGGLGVFARSADESFDRRAVYSAVGDSGDLYYVSYDRSYQGLPVLGGDAVVATDSGGAVLTTVAAHSGALSLGVVPKVSAADAAATAGAQLGTVEDTNTTLAVLADQDGAKDSSKAGGRLVYENVVTGYRDGAPSRLHVRVDALTGAVLDTVEDAAAGTGTSQWNGPNPLHLDTTHAGAAYTLADPLRPGVQCQDYTDPRAVPLSKTVDTWGTGNAASIETGCVDVLWSTQHEWDMLRNWLGRNGIDGAGHGFPIRVGLPVVNAYWAGNHIEIGHNYANQWIGSMDVVGHEHGHAIDQFTPGGTSQESGLGEGTGDIFGALTEAYTNEPAPYDRPDYLVGETINLVGTGPIRNMYNPSLVNGDPNCYSPAIPTTEVHKAAGPLNHWFYLLAAGSNPAGGPVSPTCNGTTLTGLGIQTAGRVFYNAMLLKTSGMTYAKYRTATLTAAKNLDPSCGYYNTVKAAWNAVSVPAQAADPTCAPPANPPFGYFDVAAQQLGHDVYVAGWAIDPDSGSGPIQVQVAVDGGAPTYVTANLSRLDVGNAYPQYGPNHGFSITTQLAFGTHSVCVSAVNTGQPGPNVPLPPGCRSVIVVNSPQPPGPTGQIVNVATGKCMDIRGGINTDLTPVQLYPCNGTLAQRWTVASPVAGTIWAMEKCLDVYGGFTTNGNFVNIYTCNGTASQKWTQQADGTLKNPMSNRCLVDLGAVNGGSQLGIWDCNTAAYEKWTFPHS